MFNFRSCRERIVEVVANDRMAIFLRFAQKLSQQVFVLLNQKEAGNKAVINGEIEAILFHDAKSDDFSQTVWLISSKKERVEFDTSQVKAVSFSSFSPDECTLSLFSTRPPPSFDKFPVLIKELDCAPYDSRDFQYMDAKASWTFRSFGYDVKSGDFEKVNTRFLQALRFAGN